MMGTSGVVYVTLAGQWGKEDVILGLYCFLELLPSLWQSAELGRSLARRPPRSTGPFRGVFS